MTELELWLDMGTARRAALAAELECSLYNVTQLSKSQNIKDINRIRKAINNIEQREMRSERCSKNNVLGAARFVAHSQEWVRKKAQFSLAVWADVYARHC